MDVSMVICTHNRSRLLREALTYLVEQDLPSTDAEIIVVDNNSSDDSEEVVQQIASAAPIPVRYVFEPAQGISYARNRGALLARSPIVAFTDDDVHVAPDWAARIHAAFSAHSDIDCVGGKVLPIWPRRPPSWLTRGHWSPLAILDYGDHPLDLGPDDPRCLIGANLACRREVVLRLGGFSPALQRVKDGIGSIEDHDFLIRFWKSGGRARYLPELVVMSPVDLPRLKRRYHRRWHRGHGHYHAVMRSPALEQSVTGRLFDVPAHLYRQFATDAAAWVDRFMSGHLDEAFLSETRMWFFWGFFETRRREYLSQHSRSAIREIAEGCRNAPRLVRAQVARTLHRVDDRLTNGRALPRHVMFEAANPMLFNVFRPVYDRLSADPRIRLTLVPCGHEFDAAAIFVGASGRDRLVPPWQAAWMKPDVYINTDLWSMTWLHRRVPRVHLFHGVAGKYDLDAPVDLAATVRAFDRVLFPNHDRLARYVVAGLIDPATSVGVVTGYPKADCLVDGSLERGSIAARLGLDPGRPTVIYAPTWSEHSSLNRMGEQVITSLADAGLNVLVKLHACSYVERGAGGIDWRARLRPYAARPNVFVVDDPDASPYLFVSDVLVTDHSTVGFEFMLLDRPVIVLHQPALIDHARISREKVARLQSAARVVHDIGQLTEAVREELRWPARLSHRRRQLAEELFFGSGRATERVLDVLYGLLALPAPRSVDAESDHAVAPRTRHGEQIGHFAIGGVGPGGR